MKIDELALITAWMKKTDLTELLYRKNDDAVNIRTEDAPFSSGLPSCSLSPYYRLLLASIAARCPDSPGRCRKAARWKATNCSAILKCQAHANR